MFHRAVPPDIEIRLLEAGDAEAIYPVVERNRAYLREWLPWVDGTHSPEDIRNFIETVAMPQYETNKGPSCGIRIGGEFVGSIGCHEVNLAYQNCSMGYWVDAAHQGKGVITKCSAAMLDYLFDELRLHRVVIECAIGNTRSCAIPERLGFTREGVKREAQLVSGRWLDLAIWSILDREWRSRPRD